MGEITVGLEGRCLIISRVFHALEFGLVFGAGLLELSHQLFTAFTQCLLVFYQLNRPTHTHMQHGSTLYIYMHNVV